MYGKTEARLEKGKKEIQLGIVDRADTIVLYIQGLCMEFGPRKNKKGSWSGMNNWGYHWDNCTDGMCRKEYDYKMDFKVKVPSAIHVMAATVNDGNVDVRNTKGVVVAHNINGSIRLTNLTREAEANTINGDVDIEYTVVPKEYCRFYSLNGNINAWFPRGLAANVGFESFNGDFYTNIDKLESLPPTVETKPTGDGIKYKVNTNRFKVGNGGVLLDFETFNGNVYLKERD